MTFPTDSYTPFGYLANPFHRARSWSDVEAGLLRTTDNFVGFGWVEPTARRPSDEAAIVLVLKWNGQLFQTRADFNRIGLWSSHHTSACLSFDWRMDAAQGSLTFALADRDALVGELRLANTGGLPSRVEAAVFIVARSTNGRLALAKNGHEWLVRDGKADRAWAFETDSDAGTPIDHRELASWAPDLRPPDGVAAGYAFRFDLASGDEVAIGLGLERRRAGGPRSDGWAARAAAVCAERRREDDDLYASVALPVGDWPASWKRGWIYDLETTRACIFPPGGIFTGEWISWMISWPRVVVAEGTLDAARFSYADPQRALSFIRTLFVDAPAPNVPCVFPGGEPNMVAKDGTVCGTSPAWCLPFHNLWLLYCRTLDREWLGELVPRLEGYLDYWLRERIDDDGWIVYKCTWEAGEDCTPRLDPGAAGDEVISRWVRPVELQATMAHSAAILAQFCAEIGDSARSTRWRDVAADYARRTQALWDGKSGRYRDWDKRTGAFLESPGVESYWKTDPVRFSPLSLTPIVAGLADARQLNDLATEIAYYDTAPWCLWPSWSYVVAEAATAAGWHEFAGRFARRIVDRVYRSNDRRTLADAARPTPGTAPEFWPLDLAEFNGSDGYGWGANTTTIWVRQIFGFLDADPSPDVAFNLAPSLPTDLLRPGRRFGFTNLPYRGDRLDLAYEVTPDALTAVISADDRFVPTVTGPAGESVKVERDATNRQFRFAVRQSSAYRVVLAR